MKNHGSVEIEFTPTKTRKATPIEVEENPSLEGVEFIEEFHFFEVSYVSGKVF